VRERLCVYVFVFACERVRESVSIYAFLCTYVCMYVRVYVYVHACSCTLVCLFVCLHVCVCRHVCVYACMHAYMSACMHVCMYMCMHVSLSASLSVCLPVSPPVFMHLMCVYIHMYVQYHRALQHTAIHCNTLQHIATYCNTLKQYHTLLKNNTVHTNTRPLFPKDSARLSKALMYHNVSVYTHSCVNTDCYISIKICAFINVPFPKDSARIL